MRPRQACAEEAGADVLRVADGNVDAFPDLATAVTRRRVDELQRTGAVRTSRLRPAGDVLAEGRVTRVALVKDELAGRVDDRVLNVNLEVVDREPEVLQDRDAIRSDHDTEGIRLARLLGEIRITEIEAADALQVGLVQRERSVGGDVQRYARLGEAALTQRATGGGRHAFAGVRKPRREGLARRRVQLVDIRRANRLGISTPETHLRDRLEVETGIPAHRVAHGRVVRESDRSAGGEQVVRKDRHVGLEVALHHVEVALGARNGVTGVEPRLLQRIELAARELLTVLGADRNRQRARRQVEHLAGDVGASELL